MDAVPLLVAAAVAAALAPGGLRALTAAGWTRANFRGVPLPFPAGVLALVAGLLALGLLVGIEHVFDVYLVSPEGYDGPIDNIYNSDVIALVVGVGLLGLLDDLVDAPARGLRGHAAAALRGELSTGVLKAAGTLALAVVVLGRPLHGADFPSAVACVVLATNLFNLLDLRPGRATKAFVLLGAGLLLAVRDSESLRVVGAYAAPLVMLGLYDLRERCMLGDTGANALGALAGLWLVLVLDTTGQWVAAGVLLALTIFGEFGSFSSAIAKLPPLRVLDSLGRRRDA